MRKRFDSPNPFILNFGMQPSNYIPRYMQTHQITSSFESSPSPTNIYMITGVRGSGKTVMMSDIAAYFEEKNWLIFDMSIEDDLLQSFAAKLYNEKSARPLFMNAKLNFSYLGFGISIEGEPPVTDLNTAIEEMLQILQKKDRRILITIDEVVNNQSMRKFASEFQILLRQKYPVFLLMTGLYENIYELQNVKTLTFLYRAPRIALTPLSPGSVAESYRQIFQTTEEKAGALAALTKGYPYAYQLLGYLCWNAGTDEADDTILQEYDAILSDYVYSKMWSEQSERKKQFLNAMAQAGDDSVSSIREAAGMDSQAFSVYRSRLLKQGLIQAPSYGHLDFALPRFKEFVRMQVY